MYNYHLVQFLVALYADFSEETTVNDPRAICVP